MNLMTREQSQEPVGSAAPEIFEGQTRKRPTMTGSATPRRHRRWRSDWPVLMFLPKPLMYILLVALSCFSIYKIYGALVLSEETFLMDVQVFQDAGFAFVRGDDLYEDFPTRSGFRFIYPPIAALLFAPLTWFGQAELQLTWNAATIAAMWFICFAVSRSLKLPHPMWMGLACLGPALMLDPITENLRFGQINVFLVALVAADVLGVIPRRFRGVGIGLAAAIKVTPAAYAILFLAGREWKPLLRSAATFVVSVLVGFLIRPHDAWFFWTEEFSKTDRGGAPSFAPNQAFSGILARAEVPENIASVATYAFFIFAALATWWAAHRMLAQHRPVIAVFTASIGIAVASPITVTHHWASVLLALPLILVLRSWSGRIGWLLFFGAHYFAPWYLFEEAGGDAADDLVLQTVGNAQAWTGLLAFAGLLWAAWRMGPVRGQRPGVPTEERSRIEPPRGPVPADAVTEAAAKAAVGSSGGTPADN